MAGSKQLSCYSQKIEMNAISLCNNTILNPQNFRYERQETEIVTITPDKLRTLNKSEIEKKQVLWDL